MGYKLCRFMWVLVRVAVYCIDCMRYAGRSVFILSLVSFLFSCSDSNSSMPNGSLFVEPRAVNVVRIHREKSFTAQREFAGRVEANHRSRLGFEFVGKVVSIDVEQGQRVVSGAALASLDTGLLNLDIERLKAQVKEISVMIEQTETDINRQEALKRKGLSVGQQLDSLRSQLSANHARHAAAKAELAGLELRRKKSTLYAPFDGEVAEVYLEEGETVGEAQPLLLLVEASQREATFGIPQDQGEQLSIGQKLPILGAFGMSEGTVKHIRRSVSAGTLSRTITLNLPEQLALSDGVIIYLVLPEKRHLPGFWLPQSALIGDVRGTWSIYALTASGSDNESSRLRKHVIQHIYQRKSAVYVQSDLAEGTEVVVNGTHSLAAGIPVAPRVQTWQASESLGH